MFSYVVQIVLLLLLPAIFIVSLWRSREAERLRWLLKVVYGGAFIGYLYLIGRWDLISIHLRDVIAVAYAIAAAKSFPAARRLPWIKDQEQAASRYARPLALTVLSSGLLFWALMGQTFSATPVTLTFPLHGGRFYVGQGGDSIGLNHHHANRAQRYALDVVELNSFGSRSRGLYPPERGMFVIFGEAVYSPCNGRVEAAVDTFADLPPSKTDREHAAGNHVVLACKGVLVLLAHLKRGSVAVRPGESVDESTLIGAVGNTGNTSEPHLHLHAVREGSGDILDGEGVPMTFAGVFPVRNSVL